MEGVEQTGFVSARQPSRRGTQGRQRRAAGGRKHQINVKVSVEELALLQQRAQLLGLSVPRLMVESGLTVGGGSAPSVAERHAVYREMAGVRRLLAAVGNNVNQLTRAANATGELEPETEAALDAVMRLVLRMNELLEAMPAPPDRSGRRSKKEGSS